MDLSPTLNASPMMVAHAAACAAAPGHLVLYRVGEFYEVLLDDAVVVSRALGIQLTRRRQKDAADIPMCGIPAATAGSAVNRRWCTFQMEEEMAPIPGLLSNDPLAADRFRVSGRQHPV